MYTWLQPHTALCCNCSSTTFLGSCGYNLPLNSKTSWLSASSVVSADRELLIVMDIHYKHSPMLKSLHKSTILFSPFWCSFLAVKKFSPSVSYLVMNQCRDMSISIIFIPCICLLSIHIGICSKCNKYHWCVFCGAQNEQSCKWLDYRRWFLWGMWVNSFCYQWQMSQIWQVR